ncbi:MAG: hypothetical protein ACRBN8_32805 [Nannocystales bacterium]
MRPLDRLLPTLLLLAPTACDDANEVSDVGTDLDPVFRALTSAEGEYFDVETWPREATGVAMRSTGHLIVRLDGPAATGPANPPTEDDLSGTCGVTFVSSRIAVTAGHCLPGLSEFDEVEVRTPRVLPGFTPTPTITGTFPDYIHADAPGYFYDRYLCQVRSRCYTGPGASPPINCDIAAEDIAPVPLVNERLDIGILECDALDGARHDYVDVAPAIAEGDRVALPWYHELYEAPQMEPLASDFYTHYVQKVTSSAGADPNEALALNYHYRGAGERHQMLPLLSTDYYLDRWKILFPPTTVVVNTNLRGCHGTSGSGVMSTEASSYPELVGPVTTAQGSISGQLCHVAGADPDTSIGIQTMHPSVTKHFVDQFVPPSCSDPDSFPYRLAYWLSCDILSLDELEHDTWRFRPSNCPWCLSFSRLDHAVQEAMRFPTPEPTSLALRPNDTGLPYRASVRVWTNDFPSTVELRMGSTVVATHTFTGQDEDWLGNYASKVLSGSFISDANIDGPLTIATAPGSAAQELSVSQVLLVPDGQPGAFETMHRRMSYGLLDLQDLGADARPATFTASDTGGFAAGLEPSQRLVATGLALTADGLWHVSMEGDQANLSCGLMFADGSETGVPCATHGGGVTLDGTGHDAPIALFIETDGNAAPVTSLSDLVVQQVQACQPAHDTCDTGGPLQPACDECVAEICAVDPYCCNTAWDSICVGEVQSVCNQVQCDASVGSCAHSVCGTGTSLSGGCDTPISPSCTSAICNVDPYCCNTAWDSICVGEVVSVCGLSCG